MIGTIRAAFHPLLRRVPGLRRLALAGIDIAARPLLLPFRLDRPRAPAGTAEGLERRTDEFNQAAEDYFAGYPNVDHLLDKPFSEPEALSRRLIDLGVLIDGMRLRPGDTVLDLGAGTAWLSHFLNRYGCRTIAVDVSPTALDVGRKVFERDPHTNWALQPQFLAYDGHTLPLEAASVDRIVIYDAYHHLPNPRALMREMLRVLRPDGIAAMSEPGRGHAASGSSLTEAASGVLENELVLEDIADLALTSGFQAARVIVATNTPLLEIDARELRSFMGGRGFAAYWKNLCAALDGHHYLLLFRGDPGPTTARPRRLKAVITIPTRQQRRPVRRGESSRLEVHVHNAGDTTWIHEEGTPGWTRLGVHLYRADRARTLIDFDWYRAALPADVSPDRSVRVALTLPPIAEPGDYRIAIDLVIEGVAWFSDRGSMSIDLPYAVQS